MIFDRNLLIINSFLVIQSRCESKGNEVCRVEDICQSHKQLSTAMEDLNCLFSIQLLLWMMIIVFNIISRTYVFFTYETISTFAFLRELLLLMHYVKLLLSLTIVCHITAEEVSINL